MEKKLLVLDDEPQILKALATYFNTLGYQVFSAESGAAALELFKSENILVVVSDLNMPGMNGLEFCEKIKAANPAVIAIALTGQPGVFEVAICRAAGFDDYFSKPADLGELGSAVAQSFKKLERWRKGGASHGG